MNATQEHEVYLFDPHPGLMGCTEPLPESIRLVAESLDGRMVPLSEAVSDIRGILDEDQFVWVHNPEGDSVCTLLGDRRSCGFITVSGGGVVSRVQGVDLYRHNWRVISFRELR